VWLMALILDHYFPYYASLTHSASTAWAAMSGMWTKRWHYSLDSVTYYYWMRRAKEVVVGTPYCGESSKRRVTNNPDGLLLALLTMYKVNPTTNMYYDGLI
jgi:hypothetical protein